MNSNNTIPPKPAAATHSAPASSARSSTAATPCGAADLSPPLPEHAWLEQFAGDWDLEIEISMVPGQPPMKSKGLERGRMVGGFWLVSEARNLEMPFTCQLTLGYEPKKKKYVGAWIDSMSSYLWHYEGVVDATGRKLTLETEGPFPPVPGSVSKFREVTEFKSDDHRVFTSSRLGEDGNWSTHLTIDFRRKK